MALGAEMLANPDNVVLTFLAMLLVAKLCWECAADLVRERLLGLEAELVGLARHGRLSTEDPAYAILRDSILGMVRFLHTNGMVHHLGTCLLGSPRMAVQIVDRHTREWTEALASVGSDSTRADLADLRRRLRTLISGWMTLGISPLAAGVSRAVLFKRSGI